MTDYHPPGRCAICKQATPAGIDPGLTHGFGKCRSYPWNDEKRAELSRLFHLAKTALAGRGPVTRLDQRLWASSEYAKRHPECHPTAAYKELDRADAWRSIPPSRGRK